MLLGRATVEWQDSKAVLALFGRPMNTASKRYRAFVGRGIGLGRLPQLTGGGLIRSTGGWKDVKDLRRLGLHVKGDERILGDGDFVQSALAKHEEQMEIRCRLKAQGYNFARAVARVAQVLGIDRAQIMKPGKEPERVAARSLVCHWAVDVLKMNGTEVGCLLGMVQSAVSRAARRGERMALARGFTLQSDTGNA